MSRCSRRQRRALVARATQGPSAGLGVSDVTVVSPERAVRLEHVYVRILHKFLGRGETQYREISVLSHQDYAQRVTVDEG
jgi:hypothetical protein